MTATEVAAAVGGRLSGLAPEEISSAHKISGLAQTDSREVHPGDVFFARRGEVSDGHLFAAQAVERGAALLVVERKLPVGVPQVVVSDATIALGMLAKENIRRAQAAGRLTVVGVTGSNGKTTTKNLIEAMADTLGPTVANIRSFNNEVGSPITMLRVAEDTLTLISEMGANAEGDVAKLVDMARPDIGVVLSVGLAHAGGFGGIESTFRAKSEMVRDLPPTALAVLNRDDPWVSRMADCTEARIVWFGTRGDADVRASDIEASATGTSFTLHLAGESLPVNFRVLGEHHVANALAAAAVGLELGLTPAQIVDSLELTTIAAPGRMQVFPGRDGITVINDAYNASPDSMSAALKTLAQIARPGARTVAVLGAMSELGELAGEEHDRIGLLVVRLGISELVVVGREARRLHISAINEGSWDGESVFFEDHDDALAYLVRTAQPEDTILLKSSNAVGLQQLGDRLGEALA